MQKNELKNQKSPYLKQHADNPVHWYPWCEKAFEKAQSENKPVFLSIGYSTCHWCHVMAHESFEDETIAALFNKFFICIKVDREERPDIDNIYMNACHVMTGSGGWPLSIFMTPDRKPFYAGTYIPKENKYGRMGLTEILPRIFEAWNTQKTSLLADAETIFQALVKNEYSRQKSISQEDAVNLLFQDCCSLFDEAYGGFGRAPKFPSAQRLLFLFSFYQNKKIKKSCDMAVSTLQKMMCGGIFDQLGGGFHRYSTDKYWIVPHFEKMLYDQALLIQAYARGFRITGDRDFADTVKETAEFCIRELISSDSVFYSAFDADSEGKEGAFYLWSDAELKEALPESEYCLAKELFLAAAEGNFIDEAKGVRTGKNILYLNNSCRTEEFIKIKSRLFQRRELRVRPHRDDKILADCNGMMISALAAASEIPELNFKEYARRCADTLIEIIEKNGGMFHACIDGEVCSEGFIDDYAFFIQGMLDLYETDRDEIYLKQAVFYMDECIEKLWGDHAFYYASESADRIIRNTEIFDSAIPSGNAVMLGNLIRLFKLTSNKEYSARQQLLKTHILSHVSQYPQGSCAALHAMLAY